MPDPTLKPELDFYIENQGDLLKRYNGRCIVIKGKTVIGDYSSEVEALRETLKTERPGTFLVQRCEPGSPTQSYHSRVAFA